MLARFTELTPEQVAGTSVILDVDGTLVPDGDELLSTETGEAVRRLAGVATIYLCSNSQSNERVLALAKQLGVKAITGTHKKPSTKVLRNIEGEKVVVGDKYITDGLLAAFAGIRYIPVRRLRGGKERLIVELSYVLDALLGRVLFFLVRLLRPS